MFFRTFGIPQRGKFKHYGEWRAEQEDRPTYLSLIKADVDAAIRWSMTERQFFYRLRQMGYDVKVGKDITVRPYDQPHGRKLVRNLGEAYSLENICKRILAQRLPQREETPKPRRCRLLGDLKQARKVTGFRALYFHYCYLLGVFPQKQDRQRGLFLSCGKTFSGMERGAARLAEKAGGEESSVKSELRGLKAAPDASHRQRSAKSRRDKEGEENE